jgi:hypothetical protein
MVLDFAPFFSRVTLPTPPCLGGIGMRSIAVSIPSSARQYCQVGKQGGFSRAFGAEEVAETVGYLGGAVGLLARAATGARHRAAESL